MHRSLTVDYVRFDDAVMRHEIMNVGTFCTDVKQFREALRILTICEGRDVMRPKNDLVQVSPKCKTIDCAWCIYRERDLQMVVPSRRSELERKENLVLRPGLQKGLH